MDLRSEAAVRNNQWERGNILDLCDFRYAKMLPQKATCILILNQIKQQTKGTNDDLKQRFSWQKFCYKRFSEFVCNLSSIVLKFEHYLKLNDEGIAEIMDNLDLDMDGEMWT